MRRDGQAPPASPARAEQAEPENQSGPAHAPTHTAIARTAAAQSRKPSPGEQGHTAPGPPSQPRQLRCDSPAARATPPPRTGLKRRSGCSVTASRAFQTTSFCLPAQRSGTRPSESLRAPNRQRGRERTPAWPGLPARHSPHASAAHTPAVHRSSGTSLRSPNRQGTPAWPPAHAPKQRDLHSQPPFIPLSATLLAGPSRLTRRLARRLARWLARRLF